ncbi:MAG: 16S rRNA (cytosine(967)-C(5))-methyltransferase RsmB [Syntrophomonadaceae bacterium]|nr:16S rRNA (cytosine(967)-C(5))-methyltransferase RsmB [Syntrophomonadaceae bacterium]
MGSHNHDHSQGDPRKIALLIVHQVLEKGAYANIALDQYLRTAKLMPEDRHLVTEIVNGTIRMLKHLDWVLNLFLSKPVAAQNPWLRDILRISLYQMLFMDNIPDYASVNSAVKLAGAQTGAKLAGVANGVLRNIARNRESLSYPDPGDLIKYLSIYCSQPEWLIQMLLTVYQISEVKKMLAYFNERPGLVLRSNSLLGGRGELIEALRQEGVNCAASPRTPWAVLVEGLNKPLEQLAAYQQGRFYVQNEASMLAVAILKPEADQTIVDLGCGAGGKTTFMAELMNNRGIIEAYDIYKHKITLLKSNCQRLRISIVNGYNEDILVLKNKANAAQGVLLDAPCSGLGVLNRRADSRWRKNQADIDGLTAIQLSLLEKAGQMAAPGGTLVYSTCTVNPHENEAIVLKYLDQSPGFHLEGFAGELGFFPLDEADRNQATGGMLTIRPGKYGTDGMFYARMRRG